MTSERDMTLIRLEIVLCMLAEDPELFRIVKIYFR